MKYIDSTHEYFNEKNEKYISVTSLLKRLEPKEDWDEIARKYAKKHKMTVEDVKKAWDYERDKSIIRGKKTHALEETTLINGKTSVVFSEGNEKILKVVPSLLDNDVKESFSTKLEEGDYPELLLWLDSCKLAGQADRVRIVNNTIHIDDYKTNKKIDRKSFVDYRGQSKKLMFPCQHLDACNFNIYSLQLNLYAYIIKRNNPKYKIGTLRIIHFKFDEDDNVISKEPIVVPNLQKEIEKILTAFKNKKI